MDRVARLLFGLLLALGAARTVGYLAYAFAVLPSPLEVFHLEAKMVLLAYRVQVGASLYPDWRGYPHVSNFFGPLYFALVGWIGRAAGSDIDGLFRIGRGISFASGLATTALLGIVAGRRYGRGAGLAAAVMGLGALPMFGFSTMVRPDLLAELLGVSGFFLSGGRSRASGVASAVVLALAILTKQTAVVFLAASALGLAASGEWRRALGVFVGGAGLVLVVVGAGTALAEPLLARSLVAESASPWAFADWLTTLRRTATLSPDLLVIPPLGIWLWTRSGAGPEERRWAILAAVLLASSLVLSGKKGADQNYYLSLRAPEALAVGALCHALREWKGGGAARPAALAGAILLAAASAVPSVFSAATQALSARAAADELAGPRGQALLRSYARNIERMRDPDARILTDSGLLDLYQGERAAIGDPWLFRMLVDEGLLDPALLRRRIEEGYYDLIITTSDLFSPDRGTQIFGLPMTLVAPARERYAPLRVEAGLFFYGRRGDPGRPQGPGPVEAPG